MTSMINQHPITPPPELVQQWASNQDYSIAPVWMLNDLATRAAQWSADQELEACCKALNGINPDKYWSQRLRAARRPKPPSLREQALAVLEDADLDAAHYNILLRAIEALPDD